MAAREKRRYVQSERRNQLPNGIFRSANALVTTFMTSMPACPSRPGPDKNIPGVTNCGRYPWRLYEAESRAAAPPRNLQRGTARGYGPATEALKRRALPQQTPEKANEQYLHRRPSKSTTACPASKILLDVGRRPTRSRPIVKILDSHPSIQHPQVIRLSERHAVMAQDPVRRRAVEVNIRRRKL